MYTQTEPGFYFSKAERRGIFVLLLIVSLIIAFKWTVPNWIISRNIPSYAHYQSFMDVSTDVQSYNGLSEYCINPNVATMDEWLQLGLREKTIHSIQNYLNKGGRFKEVEDLQKIYTLSETDFLNIRNHLYIPQNEKANYSSNTTARRRYQGNPIDPNTADSLQLIQIGLKPFVVKNLLNYRRKGGKIRNLEDYRKIFGMDDEQFDATKDFIKLDESTMVYTFSYKELAARPLSADEKNLSLDINSASEAEWEFVRGINASQARRIIEYREKLHGFIQIDQLAEVWGMNDSLMQIIKPFLKIESTNWKFKINYTSIEQLASHPYIDWKKAKLLVHYREQHGDYSDKEDILKIKVISDEWVNSILPYIDFSPSQ